MPFYYREWWIITANSEHRRVSRDAWIKRYPGRAANVPHIKVFDRDVRNESLKLRTRRIARLVRKNRRGNSGEAHRSMSVHYWFINLKCYRSDIKFETIFNLVNEPRIYIKALITELLKIYQKIETILWKKKFIFIYLYANHPYIYLYPSKLNPNSC